MPQDPKTTSDSRDLSWYLVVWAGAAIIWLGVVIADLMRDCSYGCSPPKATYAGGATTVFVIVTIVIFLLRGLASRQVDVAETIERTAAGSPAGAPAGDELDALAKLGDLRDRGILTQEEFEQKKAQLLGGSG